MIHNNPHPLAGKVVIINSNLKTNPPITAGTEFHLEDWWDRITGKSWMVAEGNITTLIYGMRSGFAHLPCNDEVVYGKVNGLGHLIHVSEFEEII
jgi:hypothetical protein